MHHAEKFTKDPSRAEVIRLQWVDDKVLELQAEHLRCTTLLKVQQEVHRLQRTNALTSRLGTVLIEAAAKPSALVMLPGRLLGIWRKSRARKTPKSLGGSDSHKAIEAYETEGIHGVEQLLKAADVSATIQAN